MTGKLQAGYGLATLDITTNSAFAALSSSGTFFSYGAAVDLVVSDMAPNLSGVEVTDSARIADLVELAMDFSLRHLKPDGSLITKVFHGSGYSQLVEQFKRNFRIAKPVKPKASRDRSA